MTDDIADVTLDDSAAAPAAPDAPAPAAERVEDLPEWVQKRLAKLSNENAASRVNAKQAAADEARQELLQTLQKALDPTAADTPVDPAQLTAQVEQARADAQAARLENAIYRAASTAGVDANKLTDSRSFMQAAAAIDPTDTAALAAAIETATTTNPALLIRQTPQAAASGSADMTGGTGPQRSFTPQQIGDPTFWKEHRAEILEWSKTL